MKWDIELIQGKRDNHPVWKPVSVPYGRWLSKSGAISGAAAANHRLKYSMGTIRGLRHRP